MLEYVKEHPEAKLADLKAAFPDLKISNWDLWAAKKQLHPTAAAAPAARKAPVKPQIGTAFQPVVTTGTTAIVQPPPAPTPVLDEEGWADLYGMPAEIASLILQDDSLNISDERCKKQGKHLFRLAAKYKWMLPVWVEVMPLVGGMIGDYGLLGRKIAGRVKEKREEKRVEKIERVEEHKREFPAAKPPPAMMVPPSVEKVLTPAEESMAQAFMRKISPRGEEKT